MSNALDKVYKDIDKLKKEEDAALKPFMVCVREVHIAYTKVEAINEEKAIEAVRSGEGDIDPYLEYSHTLDTDTWTVEGV